MRSLFSESKALICTPVSCLNRRWRCAGLSRTSFANSLTERGGPASILSRTLRKRLSLTTPINEPGLMTGH